MRSQSNPTQDHRNGHRPARLRNRRRRLRRRAGRRRSYTTSGDTTPGLQLAIDDCGTGYSSLSYLKRLPLDVLKIDRSFVSGIGHSQENTAIVHAIMALAKSLNLKVTGEGIEAAEQATLLGEWGCDRGQDYLLSKPLDGQTAGALLKAATERSPTESSVSEDYRVA